MGTNMLDKRNQDKNMGKENIYSKIGAIMKEAGGIIWCMERELCTFLMEKLSMRDNGLKMSQMDGEHTILMLILQYGANIKANLEEDKWKVEENFNSQMD